MADKSSSQSSSSAAAGAAPAVQSSPVEGMIDPLGGFEGFLGRLAPNVICFFSSATIMVLELIAGRLVSNNVGSSQYTWTSIIGVILAGMSIGNWVGGILADRYQPQRVLWILFLAAAATVLITMPLNLLVREIRAPYMPTILDNPETSGWKWGVSVLWMMSLVWIWPAVALGLISPVLAKMAIDNHRSSGRAIGNVYTWGAVGMIIGTFLTGFVLVSFLSVRTIIWLVAAMMAFLGLLTALPSVRSQPQASAISLAALVAIFIGASLHIGRLDPGSDTPGGATASGPTGRSVLADATIQSRAPAQAGRVYRGGVPLPDPALNSSAPTGSVSPQPITPR